MERSRRHREQRRQQEAHIVNYRHQRMKTIGSSPASLPTPSHHMPTTPSLMLRGFSSSMDSLDRFSHVNTDDDDDDVPLAVLQTRLAGVRSNPIFPSTPEML